MKLEYIVNKETKYENIHQILKEEFKLSNRLLLKLKISSQIYLNDKSITSLNIEPKIEDKVSIDLNFDEESDNIVSTQMDLNILYEDDSFLIIDKPPFTPIHPSINHYEDSLSNGVKYYFNFIGLKRKIRPINRLDKNTSGVVIFAKNQYVQECLVHQMTKNIFSKEYLAIVNNNCDFKEKIINAPIARKQESIIERCVLNNGDTAITEVKLIKNFSDFALLKCILKTGRTHQIRVHLAYIDHPILGDDLYGNPSNLISRQALHAYKVKFIHPITKKEIEITSKIPEDIKKIISFN